MKLYTHTQKKITLTSELGHGGEARIFNVEHQPGLVAKIYHTPTSQQEAKVQAMLANPPEQPRGHTVVTWPTTLLYTENQFVGFLMPKITGSVSLFNIYNPHLRRRQPFAVDWQMLHRTARNLCAVVKAVHAKGHVIGDLNESNVLVNHKALITVVDTDSFQITDDTGAVHRCKVGKGEYTPPELHGINFKTIDQTQAHDLFSLGVLLFQLLMNGFHPFTGILQTAESVGRVDLYAMRQGLFPYQQNETIKPPPAAPDFSWLHPTLQTAFHTCFITGHAQPESRPTAEAWFGWLKEAEEELILCPEMAHLYSQHLSYCPHCAVEQAELEQLFASRAQTSRLVQMFVKGLEAYHTKRFNLVVDLMSRIIQIRPQASDAYTLRALAYLQQGKTKVMVNDSRKALNLTHQHPLLYYLEGRGALEKNNIRLAKQQFQQASSAGFRPIAKIYADLITWYCQQPLKPLAGPKWFKKSSYPLTYLAYQLWRGRWLGIYTLLYRYHRPQQESYPLHIFFHTLYQLGQEAMVEQDSKTVTLAMETALHNGLPIVEAYDYLAWAAFQQQDYEQAVYYYQKAKTYQTTHPIEDLPKQLLNRATDSYDNEDIKPLITITSSLIEATLLDKADLAKTYHYRAWAYYKQHRYPQAVIDYNDMLLQSGYFDIPISDRPDLPTPNIVAWIYNEAEAAYQAGDDITVSYNIYALTYTTVAPKGYQIYRAWAYYQQGRYQAAFDESFSFLPISHNYDEKWLNLAFTIIGGCHNQWNNPDTAMEYLDKAIKRGYFLACRERAETFLLLKRLNFAIADLELYLRYEEDPTRQTAAKERLLTLQTIKRTGNFARHLTTHPTKRTIDRVKASYAIIIYTVLLVFLYLLLVYVQPYIR